MNRLDEASFRNVMNVIKEYNESDSDDFLRMVAKEIFQMITEQTPNFWLDNDRDEEDYVKSIQLLLDSRLDEYKASDY